MCSQTNFKASYYKKYQDLTFAALDLNRKDAGQSGLMQSRLLLTQHQFAVSSFATVVRTYAAEPVIGRPDEFKGCIARLSGGD